MDLDRIKGNVAKMVEQNAPESDIDDYIAGEGASLSDIQNHKSGGFEARMGDDLNKRVQSFNNIKQRVGSGDEGLLYGAAGTLGQGAGLVVDTGANIAGSITRELPESVKQPFRDAANYVGNSLVGRGVGKVAEQVNSVPELQDTVGTMANMAGAKGVTDIAVPLAKVASKVVSKPIGYTAGGIGNVAKGVTARTGDELNEIRSTMKKDAVGVKNAADLKSVVFAPNKVSELTANIEKALADVELIPEYTPKTIGVINRIKERAKTGQLNLNQLDQYRRMLGNTAGEDSAAASAVRKAIGQTLDNVTPADLVSGDVKSLDMLKQFKQDYTQASKFSDVTDILKRADGDRAKIKRGLKAFADKDENLFGWSPQEKAALKMASRSNFPEKALVGLGTFGFDIGSSKNFALPGLTSAGALASPGIGVPVVAGGTAARQTAKLLARGKAEDLLRVIEQGGKVTAKDVGQLSPKEAKSFLQKLRSTKISIQDAQ